MEHIQLRPATDADLAFLRSLYASTREAEMALVPWSDYQKAQFVEQQFFAQHSGYHQTYPNAQYSVIVFDGSDIGRLYVDRNDDEILLMEVTLVVEKRNQGIGSALLATLINEARATSKPIRLHVEDDNPAVRLYERHGFRTIERAPIYTLMEWRDALPR
ncbi:MAG TPA: GNAT family N-acetyltransferase [Capsulimonadaceae bacterium]|jgi:ribosomal protein S18 acetylase RimI-like enzyme